jgi:hypothetical protein
MFSMLMLKFLPWMKGLYYKCLGQTNIVLQPKPQIYHEKKVKYEDVILSQFFHHTSRQVNLLKFSASYCVICKGNNIDIEKYPKY